MAQMIPFKYGGFWDVPRYIVFNYRNLLLLLRSEFDEKLGDYEANYTVFVLPESVRESVREGKWGFYNKTPITQIGQIPVCEVAFDQSKRAELDASCLDDLIAKYEAK